MAKGDKLPKQTVTNAYIIRRVPVSIPVSLTSLLRNLDEDIEAAREKGFEFSVYSRRASPERMIRFLIERKLLIMKNGLVSRTEQTARYVARLPKKVERLLDKLPLCDPLILLAGAVD